MDSNNQTVACYFSAAIARSGKTQRTIAEESGFDKPNIISMFKQGDAKIPISRIPALSRALGVDPRRFLAIAMEEYQPEVWGVLKSILGASL